MGLLIGEVAERSGVGAATIRYYENIGLLTAPARSARGYRRYSTMAVEELRLIKKAQSLGFSLEEIGGILKLSRAGKSPCSHVLDLAHRHLEAVQERIRQLTVFRDQLTHEVAKWDGQRQPTGQGLRQIIAGTSDDIAEWAHVHLHTRRPGPRKRTMR